MKSYLEINFTKSARNLVLILGSIGMFGSCSTNEKGYDASGTFEATEVIVSSEANGRIMQLQINEGKEIQLNQLVGTIDSVQLYLKKMQLQANNKTVLSRKPDVSKQIASIEQQIQTAKTERVRISNLIEADAGNQKQLDDINAQILLLQKQLDAQKSTLELTINGIGNESSAVEIQIAQLDDQLQKCRIISPLKGTVLVTYAEQGELATVGKPLFKMADVSTMYLRAYVTANQLSQLKIGQAVTVSADFGERYKDYKGQITWISDKSEFTPKTVQTKDERANLVYAVKIAVPNDGFLKIGMYGQFSINN